MQKRKVVRIFLQIFATVMFLYQMSNAVNLLNEVPMMVSTETLHISDITPPSLLFCPQGQYNKSKMIEWGYTHEWLFLNGVSMSQWNVSSWGSNVNKSFPELLHEIVDHEDIALLKERNEKILWKRIIFPKYGFCLEAKNYTLNQQYFRIPVKLNNDLLIYLSNGGQSKYYGINMESQIGEKIKILKNEALGYSYGIKVRLYNQQASYKKDNCNKDENYNYGKCVDEETFKDLYPKLGCVPEWLSAKSPCTVIPYSDYFQSYADDYFYLQPTKAESKCKDPCFKQIIDVQKLDISPHSGKGNSHLRLGFDQRVIKYTKLPNYNFFNFLIDAGSSLGLWLGFSALSLYDSGFDLVLSFRKWARCK